MKDGSMQGAVTDAKLPATMGRYVTVTPRPENLDVLSNHPNHFRG